MATKKVIHKNKHPSENISVFITESLQSSIVTGLVALVIIVATVSNRQHIRAVAQALVRREDVIKQSSSDVGETVDSRKIITFQDYLSYSFYPNSYNGSWLSDTDLMYLDQVGSLSSYDLQKQEKNVLIRSDKFLRLHPVSYEFSSDRKYLLVKQLSQKVWRRSSFGSYVLIKIVNGVALTEEPIPLQPESVVDENDTNQYLRYVTWSPSGNAIAYVDFNNNLHYRHSAESADIQLTKTGLDGVVYNGIPDWVSEEEVFEDNKALWWSPDGSKLVYGVFNDTLVDSVSLTRYGSWSSQKSDKQGYPFLQYPVQETIKYPKSGRTNPTVELWVADVGVPTNSQKIPQYKLKPPSSAVQESNDVSADFHFTSVTWRDNQTAAVIWMNRLQNVVIISVCSISDKTSCHDVFNMPIKDGWVDYKFSIIFNKYVASDRFLAILPAANTRHRYRQLYVIEMVGHGGNSRTQLTSQESEVTQVVEWTPEDTVYYIATLPGDPGVRHLHKLTIGQQNTECLTCDSTCGYVDVTFSKAGSYFTVECKGPGVPFSSLHRTSDNAALIKWTDNKHLEAKVKGHQMPTVKYMQVPVQGTDQKAQVMLLIPPHVGKQEKLPLLVDVYGGPGFQKVDKTWKGYEWGMYVAGALNIVYAVIDPRGSGFQGDAWRHSVYRRFGNVEVQDTIAVTKYLQEHLAYVDETKTGIWGWSYGGYLSLSVLTQDLEGVFQCGASVAPVVRWELYDTIYTERYMGRPIDNPSGYNSSTPLWRLENVRNKKYYLIHGTHDDNVHYQQSMLLSAALEEKYILFRQQAYPDQDHSIGDFHHHLYLSLTSFFNEDCFGALST